MAAMAVIAVKCSGPSVNIQQSAEETALMMGGGGEGVEAVAPSSRAVLGDPQWGRQWRRQEGEHQPRGGGNPSEVQSKMIFMGHQISSCHVPVVGSFFIL